MIKENLVLSIIQHSRRNRIHADKNIQSKKIIHDDNCSVQKKILYVIVSIFWRTVMQFEDEVIIYFLILGHKKWVCDGVFGHANIILRNCDVQYTGWKLSEADLRIWIAFLVAWSFGGTEKVF